MSNATEMTSKMRTKRRLLCLSMQRSKCIQREANTSYWERIEKGLPRGQSGKVSTPLLAGWVPLKLLPQASCGLVFLHCSLPGIGGQDVEGTKVMKQPPVCLSPTGGPVYCPGPYCQLLSSGHTVTDRGGWMDGWMDASMPLWQKGPHSCV